MTQRRAIANSLLAIIPISIVGVAVYYLAVGHYVRFDLGIVLALGGIAGAYLAVHVDQVRLRQVFALYLLLVGLQSLSKVVRR